MFPAVICSKYHLPLYPSYFKLQGRWLHSQTPVTYSSKLQGICSLAAYLQLVVFRVYV